MKIWAVLLAIFLFAVGLGAFVHFPAVVLSLIGVEAIVTGVLLNM
jgi:hypothetical protein